VNQSPSTLAHHTQQCRFLKRGFEVAISFDAIRRYTHFDKPRMLTLVWSR
jgi:hypothetical protein